MRSAGIAGLRNPVVATAIEGTSELVNSLDLGLLVQQDSVSLSEGLERALQIGWVKTALASHARSFMWQQTALAIESILACSIQSLRNAVPVDEREASQSLHSIPVLPLALTGSPKA